MKLLILSRAMNAYSTQRLRQAAIARGHRVRVLDTLRFSVMVERGAPRLLYRDKPLSRYDAVIPRIGASVTFYGCAVVRQFEQMGIFTLASADAISVSRDKLRALQVLSRHDLGVPSTVFTRDLSSVVSQIERLGGVPVIVKVVAGTQGVGVILAETLAVARRTIESLQGARQNALIQKFVAESRGRDVRALVVGGRVVAAMRRVAMGDEFRSNLHRGGRAEAVQLEPEFERTAIRAAQILGLRVAGVDMLEAADGPQVLEVNSSPGLEGIETTTGVDVADAIIEHIEEQSLLPEVDLKQRLTLDAGYGVAEFELTSESGLTGASLAELPLAERGVTVLSIQRGEVVVPNPRGAERLQRGDVVVCFGRLEVLRELIPRDPQGRRRRSRSRRQR